MSLEFLVGVQVPVSGGGEGGRSRALSLPFSVAATACLAQLELQLHP